MDGCQFDVKFLENASKEVIENTLLGMLLYVWTTQPIHLGVEATEACLKISAHSSKVLFRDLSSPKPSLLPSLLASLETKTPMIADAEQRMVALLSLLPTSMPLHRVVSSQFVTTVVKYGWFQLFGAMRDLALGDVCDYMHTYATLLQGSKKRVFKQYQQTFERIRQEFGAAYNLGLYTMDRVLLIIVHLISNSSNGSYRIQLIRLACTVLYPFVQPGAYFDRLLLSTISESDRREYKNVLQSFHDTNAKLMLAYPHLDLTPAQGAMWFRMLVINHVLDAEEVERGLTHDQAIIARWCRFLRVKRVETKKAVIMHRVNNKTLIEFAVESITDGLPLARILLDLLVYCAFVEYPNMLDSTQTAAVLEVLSASHLQSHVDCVERLLGKRLYDVLEKASDYDTLCKDIDFVAKCGLKPLCLIPEAVIQHTSLRSQNLDLWRAILKYCLRAYSSDIREQFVFTTFDEDVH